MERYTNQIVFDKVVTHLKIQKKRAFDNDLGCVYRADDGDMCAIGALIPDYMYDNEMEGDSVTYLIKHYPEIHDLFKNVDKQLLCCLQEVHDYHLSWTEEGLSEAGYTALNSIATSFDLNKGVLDNG